MAGIVRCLGIARKMRALVPQLYSLSAVDRSIYSSSSMHEVLKANCNSHTPRSIPTADHLPRRILLAWHWLGLSNSEQQNISLPDIGFSSPTGFTHPLGRSCHPAAKERDGRGWLVRWLAPISIGNESSPDVYSISTNHDASASTPRDRPGPVRFIWKGGTVGSTA